MLLPRRETSNEEPEDASAEEVRAPLRDGVDRV